MPQLDFYSIANQLVFGSLSFAFFYLIIELYIVPTLFASIFARDYYLKNTRNNINILFYYTFFAFYIFSRLVDETHSLASSSENNLNYLLSIDKRIFTKNFEKSDFTDIIQVILDDVKFPDLDSDLEHSKVEIKPDESVNFYDIETSKIKEEENPVIVNGKPFRFQFLFTNIEDKVPSVELLNTDISDFDLQELQKGVVDEDIEGGVLKEETSSIKNEEDGFDIESHPSNFSKEAEEYAREYMVSYLKDRHDNYAEIYRNSKTVDEVEQYREFIEEEEEGEEEGQEEGEEVDDEFELESYEFGDHDVIADNPPVDDDEDISIGDDSPICLDYLDLLEFFREEEQDKLYLIAQRSLN